MVRAFAGAAALLILSGCGQAEAPKAEALSFHAKGAVGVWAKAN